jgi:hypothetical protein
LAKFSVEPHEIVVVAGTELIAGEVSSLLIIAIFAGLTI